MTVVRHLVDEMIAAGGKLGQTPLELAPAYLPNRKAADTVLARYANDITLPNHHRQNPADHQMETVTV
ncbi:hypothetical protein [Streptomyces sp. NRRL B-24720]|uniref:hypothetical protein n=1 Tax=Streptomyces sp. NRRL B-24720 TaxID=1476876 RepID=UPI0004CBF250|nr:hypothetical protein [Streptomyces sp. NRRL B-24720]